MEGDGEWFLIHHDEVFGHKLRPRISNNGFLSDWVLFFFFWFSFFREMCPGMAFCAIVIPSMVVLVPFWKVTG